MSDSQAEIVSSVQEALKLQLDKASVGELEQRIDMSLQAETRFDAVVGPVQAGESRIGKFLKACEDKIRDELCKDGKLNQKWENALKDDDFAQLLKSLATSLLALINPAFAAPTVAVLVALWLLRKGLNNWCSLPVDNLLKG